MKILFFVILTLFGSAAGAENNQFESGFTIVSMLDIKMSLWKHCGKYFMEQKKRTDNRKVIFVGLETKHQAGIPGWTALNKIILVIDETKLVPFVTLLSRLDRTDKHRYHWLIRMNETDAWEARNCLPSPTSDPRTI